MKFLSAVLIVACILGITTTSVFAAGTISTTMWGDGTINIKSRGIEHTTIENKYSEVVSDVKVVISSVSILYTRPSSITVTKNGQRICFLRIKRSVNSWECNVGSLKTGENIDIALAYSSGKVAGLDEWIYFVYHDGYVTPMNFAITVK